MYPSFPLPKRLVHSLLFVFFAFSAVASDATFGDVHILLEATPSGQSARFGYSGCYVTVTNSSQTKSHTVNLRFDQSSGYGQPVVSQIDRSLVLPAGTQVTVHLPIWAWIAVPQRLKVSIDGRLQSQEMYREVTNKAPLYNNTFSVLSDQELTLEANFVALKEVGLGIYSLAVTVAPPDQWGSHWLDYSCFELITLSRNTWDRLAGPVQNALKTYIRCGGALFIYDEHGTPIVADAVPGIPLTSLNPAYLGFGMILTTALGSMDLTSDLRDDLMKTVFQPRHSQPVSDYGLMHEFFSVTDNLNIPLRGFLLLLFLFAFIIGPLNLWYLARRKKRILLLVTVPAISLLATVLVFAFAALTEGFGTRTRIEGITLLDEVAHEATSIGLGAVYSPLTRGDGLHFPLEADVHPILDQQERFFSIRLGQDQNLRSGWVRARVPTYYEIRKPERRRERLTVRASDKGLEVVNGLGAPIEELYLTDSEGSMYHCGPIAPGQKALAEEVRGVKASGNPDKLRSLYHANWVPRNIEMTNAKTAAKWLKPNSYLAVLNATPFLGPHISDSNTDHRKSIVIGFREAP